MARWDKKTGRREVIVGAKRKAICDGLRKVDQALPFVKYIIEWCSGLTESERQLSVASIHETHQRDYNDMTDYEASVHACHLDPQSFHLVYKWYLPKLTRRFRLSYGEIVSLQTTFDAMAKSHYYFGAAAASMLRAPTRLMDAIISEHRGYQFGFYVVALIREIKGRVPTSPCRFNDYQTFDVTSYVDWLSACVMLKRARQSKEYTGSFWGDEGHLPSGVHGGTLFHPVGRLLGDYYRWIFNLGWDKKTGLISGPYYI
jgi:hypothetical protein